ncbi:hypothetical protein BDP27DRAFT_1413229 [Rhodocollybia butyracea]|uniref:Rho termination factor N-terminal domain-containing protein n=1 Tax=Rhodocollybia butyracea TaxID=206335 RepID=A0A9P5Q8J3_9AGAR|nr:hypothetical protein BDP27DRAFT_1413229 [Rhodocollybia butyracea]
MVHTEENLSKFNIPHLKSICKEMQIHGFSKLTKLGIIKLILSHSTVNFAIILAPTDTVSDTSIASAHSSMKSEPQDSVAAPATKNITAKKRKLEASSGSVSVKVEPEEYPFPPSSFKQPKVETKRKDLVSIKTEILEATVPSVPTWSSPHISTLSAKEKITAHISGNKNIPTHHITHNHSKENNNFRSSHTMNTVDNEPPLCSSCRPATPVYDLESDGFTIYEPKSRQSMSPSSKSRTYSTPSTSPAPLSEMYERYGPSLSFHKLQEVYRDIPGSDVSRSIPRNQLQYQHPPYHQPHPHYLPFFGQSFETDAIFQAMQNPYDQHAPSESVAPSSAPFFPQHKHASADNRTCAPSPPSFYAQHAYTFADNGTRAPSMQPTFGQTHADVYPSQLSVPSQFTPMHPGSQIDDSHFRPSFNHFDTRAAPLKHLRVLEPLLNTHSPLQHYAPICAFDSNLIQNFVLENEDQVVDRLLDERLVEEDAFQAAMGLVWLKRQGVIQ